MMSSPGGVFRDKWENYLSVFGGSDFEGGVGFESSFVELVPEADVEEGGGDGEVVFL